MWRVSWDFGASHEFLKNVEKKKLVNYRCLFDKVRTVWEWVHFEKAYSVYHCNSGQTSRPAIVS